MVKKSILIFGGGLNQYLLIKEARELGLISVVLDPFADAPGKEIADYFYTVAGNDYDTTKEIAIKHKVSGLVTTQMEKPLRLMAKLAKELNLSFHSPQVVEKSLDKWLMKQAFIKHNVPCAKGKLFNNNKKIKESELSELNYPLIIKPKDATSSQGVFKVDMFEEIFKYEHITRSFSRNNEIIIEEYLDGPELSVESITYKGKTTICQFTEKFITPFPNTVELGHLQPAELTEYQKHEITQVVVAGLNALGIDNSAAHTEIKLTTKGPKIIEIGARGGGDFISSYLTLSSTGINMDKAMIQVALDMEPDLAVKMPKYSYIKYLELPVGKRVKRIDNWQDILQEKSVVIAHLTIKPGDIIEPITESKKRPGFVIVKANSKEELVTKAESYITKMKWNIILN
ncbi:MAG: ATP-grasp domain-containing protein [Ignavibacteriales bacterium]|nr:ATP-grasp domain-containing protein [Ignavibacteriales bacterium]